MIPADQHQLAPDLESACEPVLRALGEDLQSRSAQLSLTLSQRLAPKVLEIAGDDPAALARNRISLETGLNALGGMLAEGAGADADAIQLPDAVLADLREAAEQELSSASLLRLQRLGHAALWELLLGELVARAANRAELAGAIGIAGRCLFAYVEKATALAELYAAEHDRLDRSFDAIRAETIAAILNHNELDDRAAGRRLRYDLSRYHVGICAWLERPAGDLDSVRLLEAAVARFAADAGAQAWLRHPLGPLIVAGWMSWSAPHMILSLERLSPHDERLSRVHVAIGEPAPGVAGFRATHHEALQARRVCTLAGHSPPSVTRYALVALEAMATVDLEQSRALVQRQLGRLHSDQDTAQRIAATLRVYLDEHGSRGQTAKRLGVHENTVSYRIRQAEEILGRSVERDTLSLRVALALAPLIGGDARGA